MSAYFTNIRFYVLLFSIVLSLGIYTFVTSTVEKPLQNLTLVQTYALIAMTFLYLALLAGPFCFTFRNFPLRARYLKARRAIGVSAFYFASLHAYLAFFGEIGGFEGLPNFPGFYLIAILLSFTSLFILFLMAATSFDFMVAKLTFPVWKKLHRLVYLVGIFILVHAFLIGSHTKDFSTPIPYIGGLALIFLLSLEIPRIIVFIKKKSTSSV